MEKKVCFISDAGNLWGGWQTSVQRSTPPLTSRGWEHLEMEWGGRLHAKPSLTVVFKVVIGGLTSIILVVLGAVNIQFRGALVPISL